MDEEKEKKRLLDSIEIIKQFDKNVDIKFENLNLIFYHELLSDSEGIKFLSDIVMDSEEIKKYDKEKSNVTINYTAYDNENKILANTNYHLFLKSQFFPEFKGSETISASFNGFEIKNVAKIKIVIDAKLIEKITEEINDENISQEQKDILTTMKSTDRYSKEVNNIRTQLLNSIERNLDAEKKLGVKIENFGLKFENGNEVWMRFYINVTANKSNWNYIKFNCVLYDENNTIIDQTTADLNSNGFIGSDIIRSMAIKYYNNIKKIKIYPNKIYYE